MNQQEGARWRGSRVNYAALNSGNENGNVEEETINKADIESQLKEEKEAKSALEKDIQEREKALEEIDEKLGPITTLDFQAHAISRVTPAIDKYESSYSPTNSRDASLDYPLYASKRAFIANKIFDVLHLKEAVEKNIPLAHLESLVEDLKYHKDNK